MKRPESDRTVFESAGAAEGHTRPSHTWLTLGAMLAALCAGVTKDLLLLTRYSTAVGVDGYYYVSQVSHIRSSGSLFYPTNTPLTLYFLSFVDIFIGDAVLAVKVGSVILHALLCLGICALVTSLTGSRLLGLLGVILAALSGLHLYLIVEYINSLGALMLLLWGAWAGVRAYRARSRAWAACSVALLTMALLSHRLILPLLVLMTISVLMASWLTAYQPSKKEYRRAAWAIFGALFCTPSLLLTQPLFELPGWLRTELLVVPRWPLRRFDAAEGLMLLLASLATLALKAWLKESCRVRVASMAFTTVAVWSLLIPLNPFLNHDTGFQGIIGRLSSIVYIQAAILASGLIFLLGRSRRPAQLTAAAISVALAGLSMAEPPPHGITSPYMAQREGLIQHLSSRQLQLCDAPIIIATHGEQFVVTATLGLPAQQRPAQGQPACEYWLLHHVPRSSLQSERNVLNDDEGGTVSALVEDSHLRLILEKMADDERRRLLSANPHLREALRSGLGVQSHLKLNLNERRGGAW